MLTISANLTDDQINDIATVIGWTPTVQEFLMVPDDEGVERLTEVTIVNPVEASKSIVDHFSVIFKEELARLFMQTIEARASEQIKEINDTINDHKDAIVGEISSNVTISV